MRRGPPTLGPFGRCSDEQQGAGPGRRGVTPYGDVGCDGDAAGDSDGEPPALVAQPRGVEAATEVRLVAAGDFGARTETSAVLTAMAAAGPDAALALGDLAYLDRVPETAWCDYVKQRVGAGFPFELTSGNHESLDVDDGQINDFSACLPNQVPGVVGTYGREYYMDLPAASPTPLVRVITTSPNLTFEDGLWEYAAGDAHHTWVANAID